MGKRVSVQIQGSTSDASLPLVSRTTCKAVIFKMLSGVRKLIDNQHLNFRYCSPMATEPTVKGIAFCGDDIEVASVLIESTVRAKDRIDAKLKKLKETGIRVDKHTIGFMLACVGRGHHLHHTGNVEADIFKRHFSGVPLFGLFGNGEIGYDYLPDYTSPAKDSEHWVIKEGNAEEDKSEDDNDNDGDDNDVTVWDFPEMQHSYSTVFVVLSLPSS